MPENLLHTLEGAALGYLLAGTFLFFIVSSLGVVEAASMARAGKGRPVSNGLMTLGIAISILLWPRTAKRLFQHRRWVGRALAKNLWGRP